MTSFRARVKYLPLPPASLCELIAAFETGLCGAAEARNRLHALSELRRALFQAPGSETEGQPLWREAVATSAFASKAAAASGASILVCALGGLLHRAGEAYALRSMTLAESEYGMRVDASTKSELCAMHGRDVAERLVREWELPPAVGACVLGWRRFGEFISVSADACAVYVGHLLAGELLHPYLTSSGSREPVVSGVDAHMLERIRAQSHEVRSLVCALE